MTVSLLLKMQASEQNVVGPNFHRHTEVRTLQRDLGCELDTFQAVEVEPSDRSSRFGFPAVPARWPPWLRPSIIIKPSPPCLVSLNKLFAYLSLPF